MIKKALFIGGAALAALVPAAVGLTANPSLSAAVALPSSQVKTVTPAHTATPTSSVDDHGRHGRGHDDPPGDDHGHHATAPASVRVVDDHGGDRPSGVSDDGPGDDKGKHGGRHGGDDGPGHH